MQIERDKWLHFGAGALVTSVVAYFEPSVILAIFAGCTAGVLKEAYDSMNPENHTVDAKDLAATVIGSAIAGAVWALIRYVN